MLGVNDGTNGITKVASSTNEQYKHIKASKVLSKHTRILDVHLWADGDDLSSTNCQTFWDRPIRAVNRAMAQLERINIGLRP